MEYLAERLLLTFIPLAIPSGGFAVVPISSLYFDVLVLWVIVMYISAYPEIIVMRNSNVSGISVLGHSFLPEFFFRLNCIVVAGHPLPRDREHLSLIISRCTKNGR